MITMPPGRMRAKARSKRRGDDPYQFVVYGDTRTRHELHRNVVKAIMAHDAPDFVVHTGDLVADGNQASQWPLFFDIERDLLRKTVFFPALGNHERNSPAYYDYFQVTKPYYSFDWGNGHFIVLNSDIGNVAANQAERDAFWAAQTAWLEDDLASHQQAAYRFVFAHHPPFTAVARRQGENPQMTALVPMFEKYRVTAGFFGHDHNYQHYLKNGVHYVITGGGGAPLYDVDKPPQGITLKVASTEHFVRVKVEGKTARMEAITLDGGKLDAAEFASQ
jgi:3',5'-cyclic AMP phosphodiesterase CpdA